MKQNSQEQPQKFVLNTPNTFVQPGRSRLLSFNTPHLSPLRMIQSPYVNNIGQNFFESQLNNEFRLEQAHHAQDNVEPVNESSDQSISEADFGNFPIDIKVTKENMIQFLVDSINMRQDRIVQVRQAFQDSGQTFLGEIYMYLYKRFKKAKKTKEEMIKYTMRKSFKYITENMKKEDPSLIPLLSTDGLQGMSIYLNKHSNDQEISIPFKKNSMEKTMNTAFLKKVFSVQRFYRDYRKFLKTFQNEFLKDNKKKVNSMTQSVKQCLNAKNYKALENYKRLPWTKDILIKLKEFANQLLNYSIFYKGGIKAAQYGQRIEGIQRQDFHEDQMMNRNHKRSMDFYDENYKDIHNQFLDNEKGEIEEILNQKKIKKKSVIILTPPILPVSSPKLRDDFTFNLE